MVENDTADVPRKGYSLFADEKIAKMLSSISPEQGAIWKKSGEYIYALDYERMTSSSVEGDTIALIHEAMKSGLRPSDLDATEVALMRESRGDTWYKNYGYTTEQD